MIGNFAYYDIVLCYITYRSVTNVHMSICSLAEVDNTEKTEDLTVEHNEETEKSLLICQVWSFICLHPSDASRMELYKYLVSCKRLYSSLVLQSLSVLKKQDTSFAVTLHFMPTGK